MKCIIAIVCCWLFLAQQVKAQLPVYKNKLGMRFILIKPGSMTVGKFQPTVGRVNFQGKPLTEQLNNAITEMARKDAMPGFTAEISKEFYIGMYEVTQRQWQKLMGDNPSFFKNDSSADRPVENITWNDARS